MTPEAVRLLARLADGRVVSGARYAAERGISRAAVWKQVDQLRRAGLPVDARPGGGYRLRWPVALLDGAALSAALGPSGPSHEIRVMVDSTNQVLSSGFRHRHALLAEAQSAGRGRRGRNWLSPLAAGVWLSFGYRFEFGLARLGTLGLVAGIASADALADLGVPARLKWPNDLVIDGRKLGGLLVEGRGAGEGPCEVVVGVGVNVRLPGDETRPDQPWIDVHGAVGSTPDRTALAAELIRSLDRACARFQAEGFAPFRPRWEALDALAGRAVDVEFADGRRATGRADGVSDHGELRVAVAGDVVLATAGEVHVRPA
jgi:BirA family biotin operon repressor/biotin-[acetyl-CoA-carboxylase] ligase